MTGSYCGIDAMLMHVGVSTWSQFMWLTWVHPSTPFDAMWTLSLAVVFLSVWVLFGSVLLFLHWYSIFRSFFSGFSSVLFSLR